MKTSHDKQKIFSVISQGGDIKYLNKIPFLKTTVLKCCTINTSIFYHYFLSVTLPPPPQKIVDTQIILSIPVE